MLLSFFYNVHVQGISQQLFKGGGHSYTLVMKYLNKQDYEAFFKLLNSNNFKAFKDQFSPKSSKKRVGWNNIEEGWGNKIGMGSENRRVPRLLFLL